jgi:hypothetical protein
MKAKKPRCQDCFFHQNKLCALGLTEACPTFRPAHPDGLRPPQQLTFAFRAQPSAGAMPARAAGESGIPVPVFGG